MSFDAKRKQLALNRLIEEINKKAGKVMAKDEATVLANISVLLETETEDLPNGNKVERSFLPMAFKQAIALVMTDGAAYPPKTQVVADRETGVITATAEVFGDNPDIPIGRATVFRAVENTGFDKVSCALAEAMAKAQGSAISNAYSSAYADGGYGRQIEEISAEEVQTPADTSPAPEGKPAQTEAPKAEAPAAAPAAESKPKTDPAPVPVKEPEAPKLMDAPEFIPAAPKPGPVVKPTVKPAPVDAPVPAVNPADFMFAPIPDGYPTVEEAGKVNSTEFTGYVYGDERMQKLPGSYVTSYQRLYAKNNREETNAEMRALRVLISQYPELVTNCLGKNVRTFLVRKA